MAVAGLRQARFPSSSTGQLRRAVIAKHDPPRSRGRFLSYSTFRAVFAKLYFPEPSRSSNIGKAFGIYASSLSPARRASTASLRGPDRAQGGADRDAPADGEREPLLGWRFVPLCADRHLGLAISIPSCALSKASASAANGVGAVLLSMEWARTGPPSRLISACPQCRGAGRVVSLANLAAVAFSRSPAIISRDLGGASRFSLHPPCRDRPLHSVGLLGRRPSRGWSRKIGRENPALEVINGNPGRFS